MCTQNVGKMMNSGGQKDNSARFYGLRAWMQYEHCGRQAPTRVSNTFMLQCITEKLWASISSTLIMNQKKPVINPFPANKYCLQSAVIC